MYHRCGESISFCGTLERAKSGRTRGGRPWGSTKAVSHTHMVCQHKTLAHLPAEPISAHQQRSWAVVGNVSRQRTAQGAPQHSFKKKKVVHREKESMSTH